ncbi:hypothetical protein [Streptococcus macedonicus]|uniref:hypothetical protein n=2 Tax=Streptococcus macedonicus TaxID=59310 RepID=UPI00211E6CB8|nr:hypothetical protein [Streptococcus macedonicus]
MGLFFYTKKGSIISTVDLPTTEIIEPKKIGMVVAVEIQSVMRKYADKLKRGDVRGFKVYSVTFDDEILYITQSGAGEIRAAACT